MIPWTDSETSSSLLDIKELSQVQLKMAASYPKQSFSSPIAGRAGGWKDVKWERSKAALFLFRPFLTPEVGLWEGKR